MRRLAHELGGQFILCQSESALPEGWCVRRSGTWWLASHPALPVIEMVAADGSSRGWLLGYPIDPSKPLLISGGQFPIESPHPQEMDALEKRLYSLGGRFAAIYLGRTPDRVYLDPCGSLAVVFCPEQGIVASSPYLIPPSADTSEDSDLIRAVGVVERSRWYPFGSTPRRGVERLLPNHALDLGAWRAVRHWPNGALPTNSDIASAVAELGAIVERMISAVARAHPIALALTAGRHTRMQLACARSHLSDALSFTIPFPDDQAALDCAVARRIARRLHLNYTPLVWDEATDGDMQAWLYRTGACVAGRAAKTDRTLQQLDPRRCILSGFFGDFGGAPLWRVDGIDPRDATPLDLLTHFRLRPTPALIEHARRWFTLVPARGTYDILEFLRLEQHAGCAIGPELYGYSRPTFHLSPFCHRRIIELTLTLPWEYRTRDRLPRDLIRSHWPELLRFPLNERSRPRAILAATRRVVRSVVSGSVRKKLFRLRRAESEVTWVS